MSTRVKYVLKGGGVGVFPTDTLYGVLGSALLPKTVQRIYKLRRRDPQKPMIILIGSTAQMKLFGIKVDKQAEKMIKKFWPGKVSIILPCRSKKLVYLHRGKKSLAFRLPRNRILANLLKEVGPLVAPTANFEGEPPAKTIKEAKRYFGDGVDFYVDAGPLRSKPSTLIKIAKERVFILRAGAGKL